MDTIAGGGYSDFRRHCRSGPEIVPLEAKESVTPDEHTLERAFDETYPRFLQSMKADRDAGLQQFARSARAWLALHPTPSMQGMTAEERDAVAEAAIARCVRKNGEPLRNYTDTGEPFGRWFAKVTEDTAMRELRRKPKAVREVIAHSEPEPAPRRNAPVKPPPPPASAPAPAAERVTRGVRASRGETPARGGPQVRQPSSASSWLRSPVIFVPILILAVLVAINILRPATRSHLDRALRGSRTAVASAALLSQADATASQYDVLSIPPLPHTETRGASPTNLTVVFREAGPVVLQLNMDLEPESPVPFEARIDDAEGRTVWSSPLDLTLLEGALLNLRIDPATFEPNAYTIRLTDTDGGAFVQWAFSVR